MEDVINILHRVADCDSDSSNQIHVLSDTYLDPGPSIQPSQSAPHLDLVGKLLPHEYPRIGIGTCEVDHTSYDMGNAKMSSNEACEQVKEVID